LIGDIIWDGKPTFWSLPDAFDAKNVLPIYCSTSYPTYPNQLDLEDAFPNYYGYSDHTHGIEACLLAVARGAHYIEKHFCLDKTDLNVRDTPFSATPQEFAEMVRIGNGMRRLLDAAV
jgi:N,N'-diacetyllegionaminate synthase